MKKDKYNQNINKAKKLNQEAEDAGLELLGPGKNSSYKLYRFKHCKHEQEIQTPTVRNKAFVCLTCKQKKLNQEAKDAGLELLGSGKGAHYRLYKFKDCKHEQEIQTSDVRRKNFHCSICAMNNN